MDTMEDLVFHLLDLCAALHVTQPVLLGASLGGWIAAEWAIRYASMLRGIILLDALGLRLPAAPATDLWRLDPAQTRHVLFADPQAAIAHAVIPDVPTPDILPTLLQARQVLARFAWQFPDNPRLLRYLYRITAPTLVVWGERDGVLSTAHAQAYREGIAGAELVVMPQSGHLPHVECPMVLLEPVLDYMARL
jgi:pimeloyl-ACP methyl ester carboxylesterase